MADPHLIFDEEWLISPHLVLMKCGWLVLIRIFSIDETWIIGLILI